ncbi:hypothetical protein DY000_02007901 [Brassica cretica]|uniref:Uncharacterized protein n=1 Tax=Brassica cretica TaxID=69181 RepID=A0ABQ7CDF4_BRACR|nr:hypothetical protein DY000_02007901 [Brassica cretica]
MENNYSDVFSPNSLPLIPRIRQGIRGITCALELAGAALSQQVSHRQEITPVVDLLEGDFAGFQTLSLSRKRSDGEDFLADFLIRRMEPLDLEENTRVMHSGCHYDGSFLIPVPSWGDVPEADEAVPMSPLRQRRSLLPDDDGPCSEIRQGDLVEIRRKYSISPLVGLRCTSKFERSPDGGMNEMAIFEAYFEAGFRGFIPSLIAEKGFYHIRSRDGRPLVDESRGAGGIFPFGDLWDRRYMIMNMNGPGGYPLFWGSVALVKLAMEIQVVPGTPSVFRYLPYKINIIRLRLGGGTPVLILLLELTFRQAAHLLCQWLSPLALMGLVRDLTIQKELDVQRTRVSTRWELMKEWLRKSFDHWDPEEEYRKYLLVVGGGGPSGNFPLAASPPSMTRPRP